MPSNTNTLSHEELLARICETVQKTRELVDDTARLLNQYAADKTRQEKIYAEVKCGAVK